MPDKKAELFVILKQRNTLFDGSLSMHPHHKVHIHSDHDAKAIQEAHLYPMPLIHLPSSKCELVHLVKLSVLVPPQENEWASPSFVIPKKMRVTLDKGPLTV